MHAFVVLVFVFPYQAKRLAWWTSPKWPILCRVVCKTLTNSFMVDMMQEHRCCRLCHRQWCFTIPRWQSGWDVLKHRTPRFLLSARIFFWDFRRCKRLHFHVAGFWRWVSIKLQFVLFCILHSCTLIHTWFLFNQPSLMGSLHFARGITSAKCILVTAVCVSVCLSVPDYCTDLDVTLENGRGCPVVVHCWAALQSVHGFCCYENIAQNAKCQVVLVLALCLVQHWALVPQKKTFLDH